MTTTTTAEGEQARGAGATAYAVREDVQSTVVDGEAVIVDLQRDAYFTLSETATVIWEAVQAGEGLEGAAARLVEAFDVEPARAREDAAAFLESLVRDNLIEAKAS